MQNIPGAAPTPGPSTDSLPEQQRTVFKSLFHTLRQTPTMRSCFHFMFNAFHLAILNVITVSKTNLQWSFLPAFSYPPLQTIYVGMTLDGKAKIKTPRWIVWTALILWNSKNKWFCICENISYTVSTIMAKHANIFGKLTLTRFLNSAFLLFNLTQMK